MTNPTVPHTTMAKSAVPSAPSTVGCFDSPVHFEEIYQPIIEPSMNTSPWAKLISLSTP